MKKGIIQSISYEEIRKILQSANITPQRTKTWKESDDPDFEVRKSNQETLQGKAKRWQSNLCGRVWALEVKPERGQNWRSSGKPDRIPATYYRTEGAQFLFPAYDLSTDKFCGHMKQRRGWKEFLQFLKAHHCINSLCRTLTTNYKTKKE